MSLPGNLETIISQAGFERRKGGVGKAIDFYKTKIAEDATDIYCKGAMCAEWARLVWKVEGNEEGARTIFEENKQKYLDSRYFWISYLRFELEQRSDPARHARVSSVVHDIQRTSRLSSLCVKEISQLYLTYLLEEAPPECFEEFVALDRCFNGPSSLQTLMMQKVAVDGDVNTTSRYLQAVNGHPGIEYDWEAMQRGENAFAKYYSEQGEIAPAV